MDVIGRLSFFASLYNVHEQPTKGMWLLYATIVVLSIIVYRLGFARKLPMLKNVIIYSLLVLGCTIFNIFRRLFTCRRRIACCSDRINHL
ncbi:hypothetical protein LR68_01353 [Anoxybacillus sp. BCO1]|nr:hypothetical protein LR68_01353 [Anoxybacillus sp. BCO1]